MTYVHENEVDGVSVVVKYSVYEGGDPTCPYAHIEDWAAYDATTGRPIELSEEEQQRIEDEIFAAHYKRGKRCG